MKKKRKKKTMMMMVEAAAWLEKCGSAFEAHFNSILPTESVSCALYNLDRRSATFLVTVISLVSSTLIPSQQIPSFAPCLIWSNRGECSSNLTIVIIRIV